MRASWYSLSSFLTPARRGSFRASSRVIVLVLAPAGRVVFTGHRSVPGLVQGRASPDAATANIRHGHESIRNLERLIVSRSIYRGQCGGNRKVISVTSPG